MRASWGRQQVEILSDEKGDYVRVYFGTIDKRRHEGSLPACELRPAEPITSVEDIIARNPHLAPK